MWVESANGTRRNSAWPIAAGEVRVAEQACRGVAERRFGHLLVAVRALAHGEVAAPALLALAARDREGDDDAVALPEVLDLAAHLDDLAHGLVAHDVALFHAGHEMVVQMEVGAADRAARHLDDDVAGLFDLGIGYGIATDVSRAVPT
jgi:hypothetical protein